MIKKILSVDFKKITNNTIGFIEKIKKNKTLLIIAELVIFSLIIYLLTIVNNSNRREMWEFIGNDIQYEFKHALSLGKGENIYKPILNQDLLTNRKYATLFPLYYYFLYVIAEISKIAGQFDFESFMDLYRSVLFMAEITAGLFIYLIFRRENKHLLGILAATFSLFNRWIINNIAGGKQDIIAIAFLMASIYFFTSEKKRQQTLSYLLFGISMGIKHIGIFIAPIYVMPLILGKVNLKQFLINLGLFLIPTLGISIPLLIDSVPALFYSMLFSFTREPSRLNTEFGYNKTLVLYNVGVEKNNIIYYLLPRLPLVIFSFLNFVLLIAKKIPVYVYILSSLFIFIAFNPVLFSQYFTWIPPFLFLPTLKAFDSFEK